MYFLIPGTAEDFLSPTSKVLQISGLNSIQLLDSLLRNWYMRSDESELYNTLAEWIYDELSYDYYTKLQTCDNSDLLAQEFDQIFNEIMTAYQRLESYLARYPLPYCGNVMLFIAEYTATPFTAFMLLKALPINDS